MNQNTQSNLYQKLRQRLLNRFRIPLDGLRYTKMAFQGNLIQLPIEHITDEFAFSLAPQGWNYQCAIAEAYDRNPGVNLEETIYFRFFNNDQINAVTCLQEILFLADTQKWNSQNNFKFYLGTYPWGGLTLDEAGTPFGWYYDQVEDKMTRDLWGYKKTLWYQPNARYTIDLEWDITTQLLVKLKSGYHPWYYLSFPSVTLLVNSQGEKRGIIVDGHHRLAILSYLGYKEARVEVTKVVKEKDVEAWYYVKHGYCKIEQALEIFHSFFTLNGRERIEFLNLETNFILDKSQH